MLKLIRGDGEKLKFELVRSDLDYLFVAVGEVSFLEGAPSFYNDTFTALRDIVTLKPTHASLHDMVSFELTPIQSRYLLQCSMNVCNALSQYSEKSNDLGMHKEGKRIADMIRPLIRQAEAQGWTTERFDRLV